MRLKISGHIETIFEVVPFLKENRGLALVDLRSPKEFAKGHIPSAVNLPLLDNEERHVVGTLYKQQGKAAATEEGLCLFAQKAQAFLIEIDRLLKGQKTVALYCWRGGMRSTMVARWLCVMGYDVCLLKGGYKAYRQQVLILLEKMAKHSFIVLNGKTGSGKTEMIEALAARGLPAINLEGLAKHRGSTFGDLAQNEAATTQAQFENDLALAYYPFRYAKKIVIELESALGPVYIGSSLRSQLLQSSMVFLTRSKEDRIKALIKTYAKSWSVSEEHRFMERLEPLKKCIAKDIMLEIILAAKRRDFFRLVELLLDERYDKCYHKSLARHANQMLEEIDLSKSLESGIAYFEKLLLQ